MTMPSRNTPPTIQPAAKPTRIDRRPRRSKSKKERLTHAPDHSDREAVIACQNYLAEQGSPITAACPLAECWREILPLIHHNRHEASELVIGVLIKEGIAPADLTMARIETLVAVVEHRHRSTHLAGQAASNAGYKVQRSIRRVFAQVVAAFIVAKSRNPGLAHFEDLGVLKSQFELQTQRHNRITFSTRAIIDQILASHYAEKLGRNPRARYGRFLLDCAAIIEDYGKTIFTIDDFWSTSSLEILCLHWQKNAFVGIKCLECLQALRWIATNEKMDLAAIAAIKSLAKVYRAQQPRNSGPRDLHLIAKHGGDAAFSHLLSILLARAAGEGPLVKPHRQIARASGACLCLIQLISGVRLPKLIRLAIGYDPAGQNPTILPEIGKDQASYARTLPTALQTEEVKTALTALCSLFFQTCGRMPDSLVDGAEGERDHERSTHTRMCLVLDDVAPGMTPGMLRDLLVWRLASQTSPSRISRVLGYKSFKHFRGRYGALFALAASQDLMR
jgi:hypothetical protein